MSDSSLLAHFYLELDGVDASLELMRALIEVSVESSLHMPDCATLVIHDPHLRWVDDLTLSPGKEVKIGARPSIGTKTRSPIFDGEVIELEPDFSPSTHYLTVRAFDRLHRLARGTQVRSFQNVTDTDVIRRFAKEVGLGVEIEDSAQVHSYLLQDSETRLDFIRKRAKGLGCLVYVEGKKLCVKPLKTEDPKVQLKWGENLIEFRPRLTTVGQVAKVTVRGWDPALKREVVGQAASELNGSPAIGVRKTGGASVQEAFSLEATHMASLRPVSTQADADTLARAVADRKNQAFIEAEGLCAGNPQIVAGTSLMVAGVGAQFSGTYFITSATHTYRSNQGYVTKFSVSGQEAPSLLGLLRTDRDPRPGGGLAVGIVTDNQDPEGWGRVKVKFPSLSSEHASDWVRTVAPGAGVKRGIQFLPEVNDEVLVGFEMGDTQHPYVIGGLWNGQDPPPTKISEVVIEGKVQQRLIQSRTGHVIVFDDSEDNCGITIRDRRGNRLILNSTDDELTVEVAGDITLKARGNLKLLSEAQVQIQGIGVDIEGGAGTVDVKGSVINLN